MADAEQLKIVKQGAQAWNEWRAKNPRIPVDLSKADLKECNLIGANFIRANLKGASLKWASLMGANFQWAILESVNLSEASLAGANITQANLKKANLKSASLDDSKLYLSDLTGANLEGLRANKSNLYGTNLKKARCKGAFFLEVNLSGADMSALDLTDVSFEFCTFRKAKLVKTNFTKAELNNTDFSEAKCKGAIMIEADLTEARLHAVDFSEAHLEKANLTRASLYKANLKNAVLAGANLQHVNLVESNIENTDLSSCLVYGLSVWNIKGSAKSQSNLVITPEKEAPIAVDDLQVAQFVYLLLNRAKLRDVLNTITSKAVLILGRFTKERKEILDALADELRKNGLLPIIFDFEKPTFRDFTETIKTLAGISLFIVADITNPKSAPLELQATVPDYQIPFVPIIQEGEEPFSMFSDLLGKYNWVLKPLKYCSRKELLMLVKPAIIDRAWEKHQELQKRKTEAIEILSINDFLQKD